VATRSRVLGTHVSTARRDVFVLYTCPTSGLTIFKSAVVYNGSPVQLDVLVSVTSALTSAVVVLLQEQLAPQQHLEWNGWLMMDVGDHITVYAPGPTVSFWCSGALLPLP
jgi:hypothetical protein